MAVVDAAHAQPSIAIHWIRNCIVSATVALAASFLTSGARYATGADSADAGFGAALAFYVVVACLAAFTGVANGVLTGAVLQRVVPFLPVRTWIALQGAVIVALILGIEMAAGLLPKDAETPLVDELPKGMVLLLGAVWGALVGAVVGAVTGTLEALVLRSVADGVAMWIGCSSAAFAVIMFVDVAGVMALSEAGGGLLQEIAVRLVSLLGVAMGAPIMLPALGRLKSRPRPGAERYSG